MSGKGGKSTLPPMRGRGYMKKGGAAPTHAANSDARKRIAERETVAAAAAPSTAPAARVVGEAVPVRGSAPVGRPSTELLALVGAAAGVAALLGDLVLAVTR